MRSVVVGTIAILMVLAGCSQGELAEGGAGSTNPPVIEAVAERREEARDLPGIEEALARETLEALAAGDLHTWAQTHGSLVDETAVGGGCGLDAAPLSEPMFEQAVRLPDEVLGELLLNFDAAIRSLETACAADDRELVAIEEADLARGASLIIARLEMLGEA